MEEFILQPPVVHKRRVLSKAEWNDMKPLIERLWLAEKKSFKDIARILANEYDICPTKRQFDHIINVWGFSKNVKKKDMEAIVREGNLTGVESEGGSIVYNGRPVEMSKIRRWQKRHGDSETEVRPVEAYDHLWENTQDTSCSENEDLFNRFADLHITDSPKLSRFFDALRIECGGDIPPLSLDESPPLPEETTSRSWVSNDVDQDSNFAETMPLGSVLSKGYSHSILKPSRTQKTSSFSMSTIWNPNVTLRILYDPSPFPPTPNENSNSTANLGFINPAPSARYREAEERILRQKIYQLEANGTNVLQDPEALKTLVDLGGTFMDQGRYKDAEGVLRRAATFSRLLLGASDRTSMSASIKLAGVFIYDGRYAQALRITQRLRILAAQNLRPNDYIKLDIDSCWTNLQYQMGNFDEAELQQREILQIELHSSGLKNTDTLLRMSFLAEIMRFKNRASDAEILHRIVMEVSQQLEIDVDTWCSFRLRLAHHLLNLGQCHESYSVSTSTLEIAQKMLGRNHPLTWDFMNILITALRRGGKFEESLRLGRQAIVDQLKISGPMGPMVLHSQYEHGRCLYEMGHYKDAAGILKMSLEGYEKIHGTMHHETLHRCRWLAACYGELGRYDEALTLHRRILNGYVLQGIDTYWVLEDISRVEYLLKSSHEIADDIPWIDYVNMSDVEETQAPDDWEMEDVESE